MSLPELDPRFDDLVRELRAGRPAAPPELRERVAGLAVAAPSSPSPRRRLRAVFVLVPVAAALAAAGAGVLLSQRSSHEAATATVPETAKAATLHGSKVTGPSAKRSSRGAATPAPSATDSAATMSVPPFRPTEVHAFFRLHVAGRHALARATQQALRIVRGYGGYVVSARTSQPADGQADSTLVLRVPVGHVQQAIARLSALGEIQAQDVSLRDLGAPLQQARTRTRSLAAEIASYEHTLATQVLSAEQRARIEGQLAIDRARLHAAQVVERSLVRQARLAKVELALTTRSDAAPVPPAHPGQAQRTLSRAWHVLGRELALVAAALLVLSPFFVLVAAAYAGRRVWRRREEARLLSRAAG